MGLQAFYATNDVIVSEEEAWGILVWFFGGNAGISPSQVTLNDRSFAQALMYEAIMKSKEVGKVERLWKSTANPTKKITKTLRNVATYYYGSASLQYRVTHADLINPKIYSMVKDNLARTWKSAWQIRINTGDAVY